MPCMFAHEVLRAGLFMEVGKEVLEAGADTLLEIAFGLVYKKPRNDKMLLIKDGDGDRKQD